MSVYVSTDEDFDAVSDNLYNTDGRTDFGKDGLR